MTDIELLQQALEWVEWFASDDHSVRPTKRASETAEAIKARLAHPKKEWIGLTIDDWNIGKHSADFIAGAEWAESILKEKNAA